MLLLSLSISVPVSDKDPPLRLVYTPTESAPVSGKHPPLGLVAYAPTESSQSPTLAQVFTDLQYAKQLGFDGVKLWNTNELYERGWLVDVLDEVESLGLKVNVVYQFNQTNDIFPPSTSAIASMKITIGKLGSITRTSSAVLWNSLFAPYNWNVTPTLRKTIITSQATVTLLMNC